MTTRNEERKNGCNFFLVGLKRSACTWCWCIYVIWSCVRFLSFCFYHIDLCVETETYHRVAMQKNFHFTICGHCLSTMHTNTLTYDCIALHFIVFIHRKYINAEMALWATTNKTRQKYHCTRSHTTRLHTFYFCYDNAIAIYHCNALRPTQPKKQVDRIAFFYRFRYVQSKVFERKKEAVFAG